MSWMRFGHYAIAASSCLPARNSLKVKRLTCYRKRKSFLLISGCPMLEVSQLSVRYGKHQALSNVELRVAQGELVVILGANGAGKSSMLRALGGMLKPLPGAQAHLEGTD